MVNSKEPYSLESVCLHFFCPQSWALPFSREPLTDPAVLMPRKKVAHWSLKFQAGGSKNEKGDRNAEARLGQPYPRVLHAAPPATKLSKDIGASPFGYQTVQTVDPKELEFDSEAGEEKKTKPSLMPARTYLPRRGVTQF